MLKNTILYFGLSGLVLFIFLLFKIDESDLPILIFNFFNFLFSVFIFFNFFSSGIKRFTISNLLIFYFLYGIIFMVVINFISYKYNGNFFVFSEADAETYDLMAKAFNSYSNFADGINYVLNIYNYDDLGAVVLIATIYKFSESNLLLNLFYLIIGAFTVVALFKLAQVHMDLKYAFLCALIYSTSSFTLWFYSSGLKEPFIVILILQSYISFFNFQHNKSIYQLLLLCFYLSLIMFFRPPITFLILGSMGVGGVLAIKSIVLKVFVFLMILGTFFLSFSEVSKQQERFIVGDDFDEMVEIKESSGMVKGGVGFSYTANIIGAMIGPLPTFNPSEKTLLSFYSPSLYLRSLLGFCFIAGIYYIFKLKEYNMFPIVFFLLLEIVSLVIILEALELRKSLPHFPFIYIVVFWFLDRYEKKSLNYRTKYMKLSIYNFITIVLISNLILIWNLRF